MDGGDGEGGSGAGVLWGATVVDVLGSSVCGLAPEYQQYIFQYLISFEKNNYCEFK